MGFIKPTFKDWILDFQFKSLFFSKWHICILLGMYIVAFFIGFLFWKSCKFWRRMRALDYIWKSGVGFTLFYFTNLFVEILGRKGSGTMIFIVSWCYGGLAMVIFFYFGRAPTPPGGTTRGSQRQAHVRHPEGPLAEQTSIVTWAYRGYFLRTGWWQTWRQWWSLTWVLWIFFIVSIWMKIYQKGIFRTSLHFRTTFPDLMHRIS